MGDMTSAVANIFQGRKSGDAAANMEQAWGWMGLQEQEREYNTSRADLAPWRSAGEEALFNLEDLTGMSSPTRYRDPMTHKMVTRTPQTATGMLANDPGYKVRLDALNQALMRGGMGTQTYGSGNFWDSVMKSNQDYASNEFTNLYNRLAGIAGTGQTAATSSASLGTNMGNTMSGIGTNLGGIIQGMGANSMYNNNQLGSGANSMINNYLYQRMMSGGGGDMSWEDMFSGLGGN